MSQVRIVLIKYFLRHAVGAAEITTISYRDAEIAQRSTSGVFGLTMRGTQFCADAWQKTSAFINTNDLHRFLGF